MENFDQNLASQGSMILGSAGRSSKVMLATGSIEISISIVRQSGVVER
jgi:hypothetical protein